MRGSTDADKSVSNFGCPGFGMTNQSQTLGVQDLGFPRFGDLGIWVGARTRALNLGVQDLGARIWEVEHRLLGLNCYLSLRDT